jgi:hypothetical protein
MTHSAGAMLHYVDKGVCTQDVRACIEELSCVCMYGMYACVCYYVCTHDVMCVRVCSTQHVFVYVCMCMHVCYMVLGVPICIQACIKAHMHSKHTSYTQRQAYADRFVHVYMHTHIHTYTHAYIDCYTCVFKTWSVCV